MKAIQKAKRFVANKVQKAITVGFMAIMAVVAMTSSAFAANADLDTVTTSLTTGMTDMKTSAMVVIAAAITILIVIFGISWLITIMRKKMTKAN